MLNYKWVCVLLLNFLLDSVALEQGSPTPGPRTRSGPWPVRNWTAQQEMRGRPAWGASSVFTAPRYRLSSASCQHYGELYNYFIIYYTVIIIEIKCAINVTCLNHPETIPPTAAPSVEKLSSAKLVPGAKKVGDRCSRVTLKVNFVL